MDNFKIILIGVGGQGLVSLLSIIDEAAFIEGYDVKSSELHGLSQRDGSVETHIIFGKTVYSPLVSRGKADLVIGLEMLEGLRAFSRANAQTKFLINNYSLPFEGSPKQEEILSQLEKVAKNNLSLVDASLICKKELQNEVVAGVYLLGYAVSKKIIPLKQESVLRALESIVPSKYLELNKKAFLLSKQCPV